MVIFLIHLFYEFSINFNASKDSCNLYASLYSFKITKSFICVYLNAIYRSCQ